MRCSRLTCERWGHCRESVLPLKEALQTHDVILSRLQAQMEAARVHDIDSNCLPLALNNVLKLIFAKAKEIRGKQKIN